MLRRGNPYRGPTVSDVLVAGHVSLDLFPQLCGPPQLEPGRLVVVGPMTSSTGGAVTNTGLALRRLGVGVRLAGKVGADLFGRAVLDALGPELAGDMIVSDSAATSYTIVISLPGVDRSFLHHPGANATFGADDVRYGQLGDVKLFHFGYPPLMPRMYADGGAQLREMFERVRAAGPVTSLDMCLPDPESAAGRLNWEEVLAATLPVVEVFAPSIDELLFMLEGTTAAVVDRPLLLALTDRLIAMGAAVVAVKLGDRGLYLRVTDDRNRIDRVTARLTLDPHGWRGSEIFSPCFVPRQIAGTTGSGDATIVGLLAGLLRGAGAVDAATAATAVGACSVEAVDPTSGIPDWDTVARRIASGWRRAEAQLGLGGDVPATADAAGTLRLGA
jgi:sugar/nucleoside kinase (ribokinase family)